jgi:hypothetical protein
MYITDRRHAVSSDAVHVPPRDTQRLIQVQDSAEAAEQRMVTFRMEAEIAESDARNAAAEAAPALSHWRIYALERKTGLPEPQPTPHETLPPTEPLTAV